MFWISLQNIVRLRFTESVSADHYVHKELALYTYLLDPGRYYPDIRPITNASDGNKLSVRYRPELQNIVYIVSGEESQYPYLSA